MIARDKKSKTQDKIKEIETLSEIMSSLKRENKKIVHCHGVFDLLHIGHIRHLEKAKSHGDVLVVTVTPDPFVNKGPDRPAFPHHLRAEAVASLDCVDYVAVNKWPTAVETIKLLKPDIYIKGKEYRDGSSDVTGGITEEEAAVKSVGGTIVFTDEITYSSSNLINRHLAPVSEETFRFLREFSSRRRISDITPYMDRAEALKVLVVGEAIIDEYQYCQAIGKSSKEPMLAVKRLSTEKFAGGILAVGNHVAGFSKNVGLLTFLGEEHSQEDFIREKLDERISPMFLYRKNSPTVVKRRLIESYFFTKLLEVYEINETADENYEKNLCEAIRKNAGDYDLVIAVDFGHGMLPEKASRLLAEKSRFLAVCIQSNAANLGYQTVFKFPRADYVCMTEGEIRLETRSREGNLKEMMREVAQRLSSPQVAVTQGKRGCLCRDRGGNFFQIPALTNQVVDRMGAGDAFLSVSALCAAQNAPMEIVGFVGNAAGAEAVATVGHRASVGRVPLIKHMEALLK